MFCVRVDYFTVSSLALTVNLKSRYYNESFPVKLKRKLKMWTVKSVLCVSLETATSVIIMLHLLAPTLFFLFIAMIVPPPIMSFYELKCESHSKLF